METSEGKVVDIAVLAYCLVQGAVHVLARERAILVHCLEI
jgi:hypothetical protein